eukprot:TRINITY_DN22891_c0_g1_i2.p1 TRINITY_DN22891_c0_g1~~TRINITY_DN22891_c0_g1_i2.p1  ORF type:complete len:335 (-),score=66.97 TRINITY_DN22891_c0_g1_i2:449-1453(-)
MCIRDSLKYRKGPRDDWYARYLITFTFTQAVDILLWTLHRDTQPYPPTYGGLQSCPDLQLQFGKFPAADHPQAHNFYISKFVLPIVVFSQHAMQLTYPSSINASNRSRMIAWRILPCAVMMFAFGCTWLVPSPYDHLHTQAADKAVYADLDGSRTLHWGGDFTHHRMAEYLCLDWIPGFKYSPVCREHLPSHLSENISDTSYAVFTWFVVQIFALLHSGIVALDFVRVMPSRMATVHLVVLAGVVGSLAYADSTIQLGSKWCTYCLVYSFVYCSDPLWYPVLCAADDKQAPPPKTSTAEAALPNKQVRAGLRQRSVIGSAPRTRIHATCDQASP